MEHLYQSQTGGDVELDAPRAEVPSSAPSVAAEATSNAFAAANAGMSEHAGASALGGESVHADLTASSAWVREHPEHFYAFSSDRMMKDRILALEQIRVLRSRVMELMRVQGIRTLLITSSVAEEGKTITTINLALALSQVQSLRLLLIDADLRKPNVANILGLSSAKGLLSYLKAETSLEESLQPINSRLSIMAAARAQNPVELLHSGRMKQLIGIARESYNFVIIDAPPLYSIADAQILANYADGAVLCVRAAHTPREMVAESASMISEKLVGAVLVGGTRQTHGYSYTYSRYTAAEGTNK